MADVSNFVSSLLTTPALGSPESEWLQALLHCKLLNNTFLGSLECEWLVCLIAFEAC